MRDHDLHMAIVRANSYIENIINTSGGEPITEDNLKEVVHIFESLSSDPVTNVKKEDEDCYCYDSSLGTLRPLEE